MGSDFAVSHLTFEYHEAFVLLDLVPSGGPSAGGTSVVVHGDGFGRLVARSSISCKFSVKIVQATVLNGHSLRCAAPTHVEGDVMVRIGVNGTDFGTAYLRYTFLPLPIVSSSLPLSGPQAGGSQMRITGINFRNSFALACYFGNLSAPAKFVPDPLEGGAPVPVVRIALRCAAFLPQIISLLREWPPQW